MQGGALYDLNSEVIHRKTTIENVSNSSFENRKKTVYQVSVPPLDFTKLKH